MPAEIEGNLGSNDYKQKKLAQTLRQKDLQIKALQSQLEETQRAAEKKIEELQKSVAFYKKRYSAKLKPREKKPLVETTGDKPQGMQETAEEAPVSPPIST